MTRDTGGESIVKIQTYLEGVHYPSNKRELIRQARDNGAPNEVISTLEDFEDEQFGGPQDVMKAYGKTH